MINKYLVTLSIYFLIIFGFFFSAAAQAEPDANSGGSHCSGNVASFDQSSAGAYCSSIGEGWWGDAPSPVFQSISGSGVVTFKCVSGAQSLGYYWCRSSDCPAGTEFNADTGNCDDKETCEDQQTQCLATCSDQGLAENLQFQCDADADGNVTSSSCECGAPPDPDGGDGSGDGGDDNDTDDGCEEGETFGSVNGVEGCYPNDSGGDGSGSGNENSGGDSGGSGDGSNSGGGDGSGSEGGGGEEPCDPTERDCASGGGTGDGSSSGGSGGSGSGDSGGSGSEDGDSSGSGSGDGSSSGGSGGSGSGGSGGSGSGSGSGSEDDQETICPVGKIKQSLTGECVCPDKPIEQQTGVCAPDAPCPTGQLKDATGNCVCPTGGEQIGVCKNYDEKLDTIINQLNVNNQLEMQDNALTETTNQKLEGINQTATTISNQLSGLATATSNNGEKIDGVKTAVQSSGKTITDELKDIKEELQGSATTTTFSGSSLQTVINGYKESNDELKQQIADTWETVSNNFSNSFSFGSGAASCPSWSTETIIGTIVLDTCKYSEVFDIIKGVFLFLCSVLAASILMGRKSSD